MKKTVGPPSLFYTFTEAARTTAEFCLLQVTYDAVKKAAPQGRGQPVLVLPGFGGHDITTSQLRRFLKDKGYVPYGWDQGINTGPDERTLAAIEKRLNDISKAHNGRKVALIGHSLGGVYARELARGMPEKVSKVITLGSPFGAGIHPQSSPKAVRHLFEILNGSDHPFIRDKGFAERALQPPPVPTTSIYTRMDGVVSWPCSINPPAAAGESPRENIEVIGSHCGLVTNPLVFLVVADRLAQGTRGWKPFDRTQQNGILFPPVQAHDRDHRKTIPKFA